MLQDKLDYILFDKCIRIEFYNAKDSSLLNDAVIEKGLSGSSVQSKVKPSYVIDCFGPDCSDLKPGILLSFQMVPNNTAIQFNIVLSNFVPEVDISTYSTMRIVAGYGYENNLDYSTGQIDDPNKVLVLSTTVYSAYIEQPNPNGRTVFTGVTGSWATQSMNSIDRHLIIHEKNLSLGSLIYGVIEGKKWGKGCNVESYENKGLGLQYVNGIPISILEQTIHITETSKTYFAESDHACLMWLQSQLMSFGDKLVEQAESDGDEEPERYRIVTFIQDDKFYAFMKGFVSEEELLAKDYLTVLDRITSVTFQGAVLDVVSPWIPGLTPGDLFYMESKYFRGRSGNTAVFEEARDPNNLYRVISMEVAFGTSDGTNRMNITAVKASSKVYNPDQVKDMTSAEKEQEFVYKVTGVPREIVFGEPSKETADVITQLYGVDPSAFANTTPYTIKEGDELNKIADEMYYRTFQSIEWPPDEELGEYATINLKPGYLWPIIAASNHVQALMGTPGYEFYLDNPDELVVGNILAIPVIVSQSDLIVFKDAFIHIANTWRDTTTGEFYLADENIDALNKIVACINIWEDE